MIKRSRNMAGPSGVRPGAPRAPASSAGSISRAGSRFDSDDNQGSEEGELLSDSYSSTESDSDGTELSDPEPPVGKKSHQQLLMRPFVERYIDISSKRGIIRGEQVSKCSPRPLNTFLSSRASKWHKPEVSSFIR